MTTSFTWFAFSKQFAFYDTFLPFVFKWDPVKKKLSPNHDRKAVLISYFGVILLSFSFFCCVVSAIRLSSLRWWTSEDYFIAIFSLILGMIAFVQIVFALYFIKHADALAAMFTAAYQVLCKVIYHFRMKSLYRTSSSSIDTLGISMCIIAGIPTIILMVSPILLIYSKIDPLFLLTEGIPSLSGWRDGIIFGVFRALYMILLSQVAGRWYCFVLVQLILLVTLVNLTLKGLTDVAVNSTKYPHLTQSPIKITEFKRKEQDENSTNCSERNRGTNYEQVRNYESFLVDVIKCYSWVLIQCLCWSNSVGSMFFILHFVGTLLVSSLYYALFEMHRYIGSDLLAEITASALTLSMVYVILCEFVPQIHKNSSGLLFYLKGELTGYKYGKRVLRCQREAVVFTPLFSYFHRLKVIMYRIPFEVTINMILTFSVS